MNKKWMSVTLAVTLGLSLTTSSISFAKKKEDLKGNLVIAGGALGSSNKDVYNEFISLAGGKKKARIGIIPAASSSLKSSQSFKKDLVTYGLNEHQIEIVPLANQDFSGTPEDESKWRKNANSKRIANKIENYSAIWFVGGDQLRITDTLVKPNGHRTKALDAIWKMYREGGVLGGTSAGAAIMSDVMITGGDSLGALNKEFVMKNNLKSGEEYEPLHIEKGLGFFKYGIVDQHFDERARLGRLVMTALNEKTKNQFAYGVDEDTALIVNNKQQTVKIVGRSGVSVVDVSKAKVIDSDKAHFQDVQISHLVSGDSLNVSTKEFFISDHKDETNGYEYYEFKPLDATGLFTSYGRMKEYLSYSLIDNSTTDAVKSYLYDSQGNGFQLQFRKTENTKGYWGYKDGQKDDYSFTNVAFDVEPKKVSFKENKDAFSEYKQSTFKAPVIDRSRPVKGSLLIAGGSLGSTNADVYKKFIDLTKHKENSKVGIIPAASSNLTSSKTFKEDLVRYGMSAAHIEILPLSVTNDKKTPEDESKWAKMNKNNEDLAQKVEGLDAVWFVGGDQTKITASLLNEDGSNSKVLDAIWETYRNGSVLGGTSAGAAIMSDVMIAGGGSYDTLASGFTETYDGMLQQEGGPGYLERGLGFFEYGIVDQHFDNKSRLGRLIAVSNEKGDHNKLSYGIDEDTALVVYNDQKKAEVVGRGGVTLVDLSKQVKSPELGQSQYKNIKLSWINQGDLLDFTTKEISINENKDSTKGYEYYDHKVPPHSGVLSSHGVLQRFISYNLVDNAGAASVKSYSFSKTKGFELNFRKTAETEGYWGYTDGQKDDYSFVDVSLDITPIHVKID
ncbi:cyanophycinase [Fictibacillus phosphorivorans]|uniref:cyanophycinase n=1 Tax=Fictibacillus phosphorivorans TaxID=1221500 RepID=UPI0012932B86|nr:cyanophycinase [Fictibacillus phosphorivorans]MQR95811.1 cyanophycinase [Fictibacillus phosphorivorans]